MIAVVTTNEVEFNEYCKKWHYSKKDAKQVRILSDTKNIKFSRIERIQPNENVCDFVIKSIKLES